MLKVSLVDITIGTDRNGKDIVYTLSNEYETKLGRARDNFVVLNLLNTVSKHHCTIYNDGLEVSIEDNNSSNGTFVNDQLVRNEQKTLLKNGDKLRVGFYNLEVKIE